MKIAISSTGNSLESTLDKHFGRCAFFVIYDTESKSIEFIPNPYKETEEKAGIDSAQFVNNRNVSKIISGDFGIKIKPLLDSFKIQMIVIKDSEKKIKEIIEMLNH